jgi:hypothetical protein
MCPSKQWRTELSLEGLDPGRQGGLAEGEIARRPPHVPLPGDSDERLDLAKQHRDLPSMIGFLDRYAKHNRLDG